jgi:hypothetical protein
MPPLSGLPDTYGEQLALFVQQKYLESLALR